MRALILLCVVVAGSASASLARGAAETLTINHVRVTNAGHYTVWVSAVDHLGAPVGGLRDSSFSVSERGNAATELRVTEWSRVHPSFSLTVLVESSLIGHPGFREGAEDLLDYLSETARPRDKATLVSTGDGAREHSRPMASVRGDAGQFERIRGSRAATLYDDAFEQLRRLSRRAGGALLLLTRGRDTGSEHTMLDLLALVEASEFPVPVIVLLVDPDRASLSNHGMTLLAQSSGGALRNISAPSEFGTAARPLLARMMGRYQLRFRVDDWDRGSDTRQLTVALEQPGRVLTARREYLVSSIIGAPWWRQPVPVAALLTVVVIGIGVLLVLRRRPLCRLIVARGFEKGCYYDVFELPISLGASLGNDVMVEGVRISRWQSALEKRGSGIELVDTNSENGTFVNGDRITRRTLEHGDRINLAGEYEFIFRK